MRNMGSLLYSQGRLNEAEPLCREALEGERQVLGNEHPETLKSIGNMGSLLRSEGKLAEADPYYREAMAAAERLRVDIAGDALARAQFAGKLNLPGITSGYARTLLGLDRPDEALAVLERGRGRAGLDLFAGGRSAAEAALRITADAGRLARYDAAFEAENEASIALLETEARLSEAPNDDKPEWAEAVKDARRTMNEKTAAVFAELRGLVPAVDPLTSEQMLAALEPGEALVTWAWAGDGAIVLVARDGRVTGMTLAADKDEASEMNAVLSALRDSIASRPEVEASMDESPLAAARDAVLPEELRDLLAGASSVIAITDGPLAGIPIELLLPEALVAYAPTATIALRPRLLGNSGTTAANSGSVVVGDPVFAGFEREEPDYPETGILLAMVADDSNAAIAGLSRGDVLLSYGEHELASAEDLGPAIGATVEAMTARGVAEDDRPVVARVWRDGEEIEVSLALGRMGVQPSRATPADGLRSMATFDRSADSLAANATALEQVRFYGAGLSPLPNTRLEAEAIASMLGSDATLLLGADATVGRESNPQPPDRQSGVLWTPNRPLGLRNGDWSDGGVGELYVSGS